MVFMLARGKASIPGAPVGTVGFDWEFSGAGIRIVKNAGSSAHLTRFRYLGDLFLCTCWYYKLGRCYFAPRLQKKLQQKGIYRMYSTESTLQKAERNRQKGSYRQNRQKGIFRKEATDRKLSTDRNLQKMHLQKRCREISWSVSRRQCKEGICRK